MPRLIYIKHISATAYRERQMRMKVEIKREKLITMHIHKMRQSMNRSMTIVCCKQTVFNALNLRLKNANYT